MDYKQKAKELVDKFYKINILHQDGYTNPELALVEAKQCALICVDEILKTDCKELPTMTINGKDIKINDNGRSYDNREYWQEVKQEIKQL